MKNLGNRLLLPAVAVACCLCLSCKSAQTELQQDQWIPVASYGEIEGRYQGTTGIRPPNYDKLKEFNETFKDVTIAVTMTLVCPSQGGGLVQTTETHEFTQYVETMGDFLLADPGVKATVQARGITPADYFWSLLRSADPNSTYSEGSPYTRTSSRESAVSNMDIALTVGMVALEKSRDGSQLRMTVYTPLADTGLPSDTVAMEILLEKQ